MVGEARSVESRFLAALGMTDRKATANEEADPYGMTARKTTTTATATATANTRVSHFAALRSR
jgi:hypothetical protein